MVEDNKSYQSRLLDEISTAQEGVSGLRQGLRETNAALMKQQQQQQQQNGGYNLCRRESLSLINDDAGFVPCQKREISVARRGACLLDEANWDRAGDVPQSPISLFLSVVSRDIDKAAADDDFMVFLSTRASAHTSQSVSQFCLLW